MLILVHAVLALATGLSTAEAQPRIDHEDVQCLQRERFTQFLAEIQPPGEVRTAKLYFRSHLYSDYYYVEMDLERGDLFHAVLPMPAEETTRVVYYLEAVDSAFQTARSEEYVVDVEDGFCRPGPGAAIFTGTDPGILIGATRAGVPALPPGFQASGIGGFLSVAGSTAAGAGGGGGAAVGIAIGAAAGAAAGVGVVLANDGDGEETPSGGLPGSGTSSTSSTGPGPTTSTSPAGPTSSVTPETTTTTTVSTSTTTTTASPLVACFEWNALGSCRVRFQSCSTPMNEIVTYEWRMLGPPPILELPSQPGFTFDFAADPRCEGTMSFIRPIRHTVFDASGNSASEQKNVTVLPGPTTLVEPVLLTLRVWLRPPGDGIVQGRVLVNDEPARSIGSASPVELPLRLPTDSFRVAAHLIGEAPSGTVWSFELAPVEPSIFYDLEVVRGSVLGRTANRISFRLEATPGESIRFRARRKPSR